MSLHWIDFGIQPWEVILQKQLLLQESVRTNPEEGYILIGEHPPIYTAGRAYKAPLPQHIQGIPVLPAGRGGQLTYHGPGQLVLYPIMTVLPGGGVRHFLHTLQRWVAQTVTDLGIPCLEATMLPSEKVGLSRTGIWVPDKQGHPLKVASIGLGIKHGISYHGAAINVCNHLTPFHWISPCGYSGHHMTSILLEQLRYQQKPIWSLTYLKHCLQLTLPWPVDVL